MTRLVPWHGVSTPRQQQGGLSITTLAISAAASVAAAIVVHEVWKGGAILGAAITPVIIAIVSETLRKPVDRVTSIREVRRTRTQVAPGEVPPPAPEPQDRFGIWQDSTPWWSRRGTKLGLATGLIAFAIGAIALTGTELIFGDSVGSGGSSTTVFGGGSNDKSNDEKTSTTETQTEPQATTPTETVPPEEESVTPTDEIPLPTETVPAPTETAPVPPAEEAPPAQTAPPAEPAPAPTP